MSSHPPPRSNVAPRAPLSRGKRLLFGTLFATLVVAILLLTLEGLLRLAGYGYDPDFFRIESDHHGQRGVRENRDFTLTYFPPALVRRPQPIRLPLLKPPNTCRIFVLGSSAAMGDPEASFSLARMLETMLRAAYPGIHFEVVNAGITAINSHVVRTIAHDCAELAPDFFIVYEGHNEVIGPFGPAAVLAPFVPSPRAIAWAVGFKRTRSGQLVASLARRLGATDFSDATWGGMEMFLEHEITAGDPRLDSVRAHFSRNLRTIVEHASAVGAQTLLCTVLVNQRDFAPFLSRHRRSLDADNRARWDEAFAAGNEALGRGDAAAAENHFRAAWQLDDQYAELAFRLGRVLLAQGRANEAREFLQRAVDLDALRFRTDSTLNAAIRAVAGSSGAATRLVDVERMVGARAAFGIPGDELLYEHVHLTFRGTWEVARVLFAEIGNELARRGRIPAVQPEPLALDAMRGRLAYTTYEQAMIFQEMLDRFSRPPFTNQSDHAVRVATWRERATAADRLLRQPESREQHARIYEEALASAPKDWVLLRNYGMALVALGAPDRAVPILERARALIADDPDTLFALATALNATERDAEAGEVFAALRDLEPDYPGLPRP